MQAPYFFSKATQLDYAIPASKIAALSSGEFVGMIADNPEPKIDLKMFHSKIQNDHGAIAREEAAYKPIPIVDQVDEEMLMETYTKIKDDIARLFKNELATLRKDDEKELGEGSLVNIPKPGEKLVSKKQRRQINKRNRQRERATMRETKQTTDKPAMGQNSKSVSYVKNDDMGQAMSMWFFCYNSLHYKWFCGQILPVAPVVAAPNFYAANRQSYP